MPCSSQRWLTVQPLSLAWPPETMPNFRQICWKLPLTSSTPSRRSAPTKNTTIANGIQQSYVIFCNCTSKLCISVPASRPELSSGPLQMMGLQRWRSAEKGLRCAAALVRNQEPLLSRFLDAGGCSAVRKLLTAAAAPSRLRSLALDLLTDLYPKSEQIRAELQSQDSCRAVLALINQPDRDLQVVRVLPHLVLVHTFLLKQPKMGRDMPTMGLP